MKPLRSAAGLAGVLLLAGALMLARAEAAANSDDRYLDGLQGEWQMTGTLLGKPVAYRAHGERVLQGGFLRLHMVFDPKADTWSLVIDSQAAGGAWSNFARYTLVRPAPKRAAG